MHPNDRERDKTSEALTRDEEFRALFERTAADAPQLSTDQLLVDLLREKRRGRRTSRTLLLVSAAALVAIGAGAGWWASTHRQTLDDQQLARSLSELRRDVTGDLAEILHASQELMLESRQSDLKKLALLLREDYQHRLAELDAQWSGLILARHDGSR